MFWIQFFFIFLLSIPSFSAETKKRKKTVCLNMIVKDEAKVILHCLKSVKPLIDYWVIVDTGSTDGTQKLISKFMKEIPGKLYERPWVHFEHNRNEALALAKDKADYSLFIDADEYLVFSDDFAFPDLDKDYYYIPVNVGGSEFLRIALAANRFDWKWTGVIHEILNSTQAKHYDLLRGVTDFAPPNRGHRSEDPQKYLKDAKILEAEIAKDPTNGRYVLHLAQTYINAEKFEEGLKTFEKRANMGGFDEEIFFSKLQIARLQHVLKRPPEVFIQSYLAAHAYRPSRAEPLYHLAAYYIQEKNYSEAYELSKKAIGIPMSQDSVLVERWIYDWGALYALIECCFHLGKKEEMKKLMEKLLLSKQLPPYLREETEQNLSLLRSEVNQAISF